MGWNAGEYKVEGWGEGSYRVALIFLFMQKTAYEVLRSLVGSEMCIRDRLEGSADEQPEALDDTLGIMRVPLHEGIGAAGSQATHQGQARGVLEQGCVTTGKRNAAGACGTDRAAVSYTHLQLPTINTV